MKNWTEHEIRDLLTPRETPKPPAGLAASLRDEIPEHLDAPPRENARFRRRSSLRPYLLAASVLSVLGGSWLFYNSRSLDIASAPMVTAESVEVQAPEGARTDETLPLAVESPAPEPPAEPPERFSGRVAYESSTTLPAPETENRQHARRLEAPVVIVEKKSAAPAAAAPATPPAPANPPPPPPSAADRSRTNLLGENAKGRTIPPGARETTRRQRGLTSEARVAETEQAPETKKLVRRPANPNDAAYDAVYFRDYGTNPFIDTEDDRLSTFGLDVDTASYSVARRLLRDGHLPPPEAVRVEELVNYFDYGDAAPRRGDFAIHVEGAPSPFGEGERYRLLRFHLRGRDLDERQRRPADLTFVVDVSGSMARQNRLGLVRQALELLLGELASGDRVALVVYGSRGRVVLEHTGDREAIRRALDELRPEGSTNAEEGLSLGYELASRVRRRGTISRVILCSDGVANTGLTSAGEILETTRRWRDRGIELTTVGVGMGNYNDILLEQLADAGNGRYAYVDTLEEARRIFVDGLTGTLQTIAAEARVQVEFNPGTVTRYRLVGYENRNIADRDFRNDSVDAGEVGAGHAVTALYEIKLRRGLARRAEIAELTLRYGSIISGEMTEMTRRVTGEDFERSWRSASPQLRLTALVAEFGEILSGSYWARSGDLDEISRRARKLTVDFPGDADVAEFVDLVELAAHYRRQR